MIALSCRVVAVLALALGAVAVPPVSAGAPTDALRGYVDRIFSVLDDPALKAPDRARERQRAVRALAEEALDFRESARRALGTHWAARTPAERVHFVKLFTDLIDHAYLARLTWDGERLAYDAEAVTGPEAVVKARALSSSGRATPVVFSLARDANQRWRIYDVSFEGMSLIGNYRAQFNKIIRASSYEGLITRLEAKTGVAAQASTATEPRVNSR